MITELGGVVKGVKVVVGVVDGVIGNSQSKTASKLKTLHVFGNGV